MATTGAMAGMALLRCRWVDRPGQAEGGSNTRMDSLNWVQRALDPTTHSQPVDDAMPQARMGGDAYAEREERDRRRDQPDVKLRSRTEQRLAHDLHEIVEGVGVDYHVEPGRAHAAGHPDDRGQQEEK